MQDAGWDGCRCNRHYEVSGRPVNRGHQVWPIPGLHMEWADKHQCTFATVLNSTSRQASANTVGAGPEAVFSAPGLCS